jgi:ribose transport system substrate-binding protein
VSAIFTPNESTTFGMLRALRDAQKAGEVKLVGFDASTQLVEALEGGHVHGLAVQNPFRMGDLGVRTVLAHIRGETVEARIDTGVIMVTADNMNEPEIRELLAPDLEQWLGEGS